jgi:hypothetical protein
MIDATGLVVDLRWGYPWRFATKAGALYLASSGVSAAFPQFELPPDTNCPKGNPVDSRADRHDRYEAASSK